MATPDVPIAKWVGHPRSYTSGRKSGQPSVIVIHTTDGHEGPNDAENGAAYDKRRTDGTSTHYFVDSNSIVQEVEHKDESHAARSHGNDIGIQIEVCGLASQSSAQWADPVSKATLENLARLVVAIRKTGNFGPVARLTPSQVRQAWNGGKVRGICGHIDITKAFPEDNGTHTDPGSNFPWSAFLNRIKALEAPIPPKPPAEELPVNQTDFNKLMDGWAASTNGKKALGDAVLAATGWSEGYPGRKLGQHFNDEQIKRNFQVGHPDEKGTQIDPASPLAKVAQAAEVTLAGSTGGTPRTS
jgi:N-acetyl-anhydromuramyl-L-alanine amidase AmpD